MYGWNKPPHNKTTKMSCALSKDSDQPGHPPSLIRVFAVCMKKARVLTYPLSAQQRLWSDWADAQADLSLRWVHSHFVGFVMRQLKSINHTMPRLGSRTPAVTSAGERTQQTADAGQVPLEYSLSPWPLASQLPECFANSRGHGVLQLPNLKKQKNERLRLIYLSFLYTSHVTRKPFFGIRNQL